MDAEKILEIIVEAKDKATETLEKIEGKLGEQNNAWAKFSSTMKIAGGVITGASTAMAGALLSTMEPYEESVQANLKLQNTFAKMPQLAHENIAVYEQLAETLKNKTAVDDDAIKSAMAMLGTFPLTGQEIQKLIPLVIDYSQKFGVDLNSAAIQVGKAMMGQIAALQRNGVTIDENLYKTDRFAAVQQALQQQVGGYAETLANSGVMATEKFTLAIDDLRKIIGKVVTEAVGPIIDRITEWINKIQELHPGLIETIAKIALFGSAVGLVVGPMMLVIGFLPQIAAGLKLLISPAGLVTTAIGLLVLAFSTNFLGIRDITENILNAVSDKFKWFFAIIQDAIKIFKDVFTGNFNDLNNILTGYAQNTDTTTNSVIQTIAKMAEFIKQVVGDVVNWFREHWTQIQEVFEGVINAIVTVYNSMLKPALDIILNAFETVVNWVVQNFPLIEKTIATVIDVIVAIVGPPLELIANLWKAHGDTILSVVKLAWDAIKTAINTALNVILDIIKAVMQILTGNWSGAWQSIVDAVKRIFGGVGQIVWDILQGIGKVFADIYGTAIKWGENLINNIIQGIKNKINDIRQAVSNVAQAIKSFLGFHSPAEEGPASDADTWAPNLIKMFTDGLNQGIPAVATAVQNIAATIKQGFDSSVKTVQDATQKIYQTVQDNLSKAVSSIGTQIDIIDKKLKLWQTENNVSTDSLAYLRQEVEANQQKLQEYQQEIDITNKMLQNAIQVYGATSDEALQYQSKLLDLQTAQADLRNQIEAANQKILEQGNVATSTAQKLADMASQLDALYGKAMQLENGVQIWAHPNYTNSVENYDQQIADHYQMMQAALESAQKLAQQYGENSPEAQAAIEQAQKHLDLMNSIQHAENSLVQWTQTYAPDAFKNISNIDKMKAGIPAYASGGIVTSPTLALVGEAGPEAIVPLSGSSNGNLQQTIHDATYQATYQALTDVMKVKSVSSNDNKEIAIRIDTASSNMLARILLPAIIREGQRQGLNLILQGVTN